MFRKSVSSALIIVVALTIKVSDCAPGDVTVTFEIKNKTKDTTRPVEIPMDSYYGCMYTRSDVPNTKFIRIKENEYKQMLRLLDVEEILSVSAKTVDGKFNLLPSTKEFHFFLPDKVNIDNDKVLVTTENLAKADSKPETIPAQVLNIPGHKYKKASISSNFGPMWATKINEKQVTSDGVQIVFQMGERIIG